MAFLLLSMLLLAELCGGADGTVATPELIFCPGTAIPLEAVRHATPWKRSSAGNYTVVTGPDDLKSCVESCCDTENCNVALFLDNICFSITCHSEEACKPKYRDGPKFADTYTVMVRRVEPSDYIESSTYRRQYGDSSVFMDEPVSLASTDRRLASRFVCPTNEVCAPGRNNRGSDEPCVCQCQSGFRREPISGACLADSTSSRPGTSSEAAAKSDHTTLTARIPEEVSTAASVVNATPTTPVSTSTATNLHRLVVSAGENKVVQLPENSVSLSAYAVPKEPEGNPYKYEWTLLTHPDGDEMGTMSNTNSPTLKLTGLKEGLYTFKVTVSSEIAFGEAFVNVTELPAKRVNRPPVVAIVPVNQTVKLPNTDTILDGSSSTDDDKIVSYTWEIVTAPMGYTAELSDTATLQLKNLIPGFYRFMLTVTDSDAAKNATYCNVTVIKETDYPPVANAGMDEIVYLPRKEVTLNGSRSTDDKGIKSWEWTKGDGVNKAVDMQNTRTPLLHLSNLEVGMYTFVLKVTDTADQTSTAEVHVFVKPGDEGPFSDAGENQEIMLPANTVYLDGSKSHDDIGVAQWEWKQVSGPSPAKIDNSTQMKATVSALTKGVYVFQLTVYDDKKASSSSTMTVTVKQTKNDPPRANAGGDKTVELPCNLVTLNGSASTDDVGIVRYEWIRDSASLASGEILKGSEHTPLLMLTSLLPGRYLFKLTVTDSEGSFSSDTASLIIKPDPIEKNKVEMFIVGDISSFTEELKVTIERKLALLLQEEVETTVVISKIAMEKNTGRLSLVFHVEKIAPGGTITIQEGLEVVRNLKRRLKSDSGLLNVPVVSIDTIICQNNCSGHGSCDQFTKQCVCEAFWMENVLRAYFGDKENNCDWSILYVIIIIFVVIVFFGMVVWVLVCLCSRTKRKKPLLPTTKLRLPRRKRHRYTLLENISDKETKEMLPKAPVQQHNHSTMISDSDLESETVFEKTINKGVVVNGTVSTNGFAKLPDAGGRSPQKVRT